MLRRTAYSILFRVHGFMLARNPYQPQRLPDSVVEELVVLLDIFPLISADVSRPLPTCVYITDASEYGPCTVYSDLKEHELCGFKSNIAETRCRKGWNTSLMTRADPESESEYISNDPSSSGCRLNVSKNFEKAIGSVTTKVVVRSKWKWDGDMMNRLETGFVYRCSEYA